MTRIVEAHEELGADTGDELREQLRAALGDGPEPVLLDLSDVTFMDSTGLSVVLASLKDSWAKGQALLVSGPLQPPVASLFSITGVDRFVTVHESREAALEVLDRD